MGSECYQNRDKTNADKIEATGNIYMHKKTNENMHRYKHRHRHRHTYKHRNIKIFKHKKRKTKSI